LSSSCANQEKEHRDGLGAFVSHVAALQMHNLALVQLQPNLEHPAFAGNLLSLFRPRDRMARQPMMPAGE
jgi:hypothetical protein